MGDRSLFDAGLVYHAGDDTPGSAASFSISVKPVAQAQPTAGSGVGVVLPSGEARSGNPAGDKSSSDCRADRGLFICVQDTPAHGVDHLASVGGAGGLLSHITSLGTDRKNWTTEVVN